jgi:hypothetical protein
MYCPNCGAKVGLEQRFCRSCGLALEKIAQSVAEQLPTAFDQSLQARKDKLERMGVAALSIFGLGLLSFFLYMVGSKLMLSQGSIMAILGVLAAIIVFGSGMLSIILFAKAKEVQETGRQGRLAEPNAQVQTANTEKLLGEGHFEPVPTVTEHTTELLHAERKQNQT